MSDLLTLDRDERGVYSLTIRRPNVRNALERALLDLEARTLEEHLALEAQIQADCVRSADFQEGLDAFKNRRRPIFEER